MLQLWWVVGQPVLWRVTADVCFDLFRLNAPQFCQLSWLHSSFSNNYCNCQIYRITFADECVSEQNHRIYQITQHFKTSSTNAERKLYLYTKEFELSLFCLVSLDIRWSTSAREIKRCSVHLLATFTGHGEPLWLLEQSWDF